MERGEKIIEVILTFWLTKGWLESLSLVAREYIIIIINFCFFFTLINLINIIINILPCFLYPFWLPQLTIDSYNCSPQLSIYDSLVNAFTLPSDFPLPSAFNVPLNKPLNRSSFPLFAFHTQLSIVPIDCDNSAYALKSII